MKDSEQSDMSNKQNCAAPGDKRSVILLMIICLPVIVLFGFMGNTHDPEKYGPSILSWLVRQWMDPGSNSSHGWLIPVVSAWMVWRKREQIKAAPVNVDWLGLVIVALSLMFYWAGYRAQQPRLGVISLMGILWGVPFLMCGRQIGMLVFFPCLYLVFLIPMSFLSAFTFPLRLVSCEMSSFLLNGLGVKCARVGTAIVSGVPGGFALDVADPCSGLQSVIAMSALTAGYAYFSLNVRWKQWILFLSAVPIAMIGNIVRIISIGIVAQLVSVDIAMKIYHDYSGYIIFATAVILMMSFATLLKKDFKSRLKKWAESKR